jgi:hypothetical protein
MEKPLLGPDRPAAPEETVAAVQEIQRAPKAVKREIKLDHSIVMSEVQLLLAEKRTAYALLRTGVTVALVPVSIWTVLVATSRLWDPFRVLWLLVPVMLVAALFFCLGAYLIVHALQHVQHTDTTLNALRQSDTLLEDLLVKHDADGLRFPRFRWRHT